MGADEEEEAGGEAQLNQSLWTNQVPSLMNELLSLAQSLENAQRVQKEARGSRTSFTTVTPRDSQEPSSALTCMLYLYSDCQGRTENKCEMAMKPE